MNRQQAINYLLSSGFSEEQINTIEQAFKQERTTKNDLGVSSELEKNSQKLEKDFGELDCISRQAVLELIVDYDLSMGQVVKGIHALPSVTPQEPKTGHWIKGYTFPDGEYWKCDKCNELIKVKYPMQYCNNCGSDNREVKE